MKRSFLFRTLCVLVGFLFTSVITVFGSNVTNEFEKVLALAEQGDPLSQCKLGQIYKDGLYGVAKDEAKAAEWFTKGLKSYTKEAEEGDVETQGYLGSVYMNGWLGVAKDEAKALEWFTKAAAGGHAFAMLYLGNVYHNGLCGVAKDEAKALEWFTKAAEHGNEAAKSIVELQKRRVKKVIEEYPSNQVIAKKAQEFDNLKNSMVEIPGKDYLMSKYEVTQGLWQAVMGDNPSYFKGDLTRPVECVSWDDIQVFLKKLNKLPEVKASGLKYRLPTADEWVYACRAEAMGDYCKLADGTEITKETLGDVAWYDYNSNEETHPVGQKKPNAYGLYDMHGNVWEWTSTVDGSYLGWGGCWNRYFGNCQSSSSYGVYSHSRCSFFGFRLCASCRADKAQEFDNLKNSMVEIPGKDYLISKYEVTQGLWKAVMGNNPSEFKGDLMRPVECVSWDDIQEFLKKLNALPEVKASGLMYRLPTAGEWEYACRAGATGDYCKLADGTEITKETLRYVAWFEDNTYRIHPVGQKGPNAYGLYDMHGNVWEWTSTGAVGGYVYCGGSWRDSSYYCRAGATGDYYSRYRCDSLGFRLCASRRADKAQEGK